MTPYKTLEIQAGLTALAKYGEVRPLVYMSRAQAEKVAAKVGGEPVRHPMGSSWIVKVAPFSV